MTIMRLLNVGFVAGMLFVANVANCQSNLVLLVSQSGDYIGQGQTYVTTNPADFSVSSDVWGLDIGAFGFDIWAEGPGGAALMVGSYTNAERDPFNGSAPGLSIFGNGRGCNTLCGSFQIYELDTDGSGNITHLWLTFTQYCECGTAPMTGEIRYNSQLAPPAPVPRTLRVPADYPTIQTAITAASVLTSDTVLVSPGVYNESVNFNGKAALLISANGPTVTVIKPPAGSSAISFVSGETTNSIVSGFTLTNGDAGVSVSGSSPTISSNVIVNCGTGVACYSTSPIIMDNVISNSSGSAIFLFDCDSPLLAGNALVSNQGGGVNMYVAGSPTIINNLIQGNTGDGITMPVQCDADIVQNVIVGNTGDGIDALVPAVARGPWVVNNTIVGNGGIGILEYGYVSSCEIINNIVIGNPALSNGPWYGGSPSIIQNNDFYSAEGNVFEGGVVTNLNGIDGNISTNPFFACMPSGDFHLLAGSPCIDAGTSGAPELPTVDFAGNPR